MRAVYLAEQVLQGTGGGTSLLAVGLRTIAGERQGASRMSAPIFVLVDDKHIPVYRIMWVSDVPHFCGNEECQCEGDYEIRLEQDESIWASRAERSEERRVGKE